MKERAIGHPEFDYDELAKAKSRLEVTGEPSRVVLCAQTKDQGLRWFRIIMTPLYNKSNQLISIYGLVIDVTDERTEHRDMVMEQERLSLAVHNLVSLVMSCNLTKNSFHMVNYDDFTTKAAPTEGVFDELIAIGVSTVPEDDRQKFIDAFSRENLLAAHARGEKKIELDHKQIGDDGMVRWIRTWVLFVNNPYDDDVYAVNLLLHSDCSVLSAAYEAGFCSASCFYHIFHERYGTSPRQFRLSLNRL